MILLTRLRHAPYPVVVMQRPLGEHIARLELKVVLLKKQLRDASITHYQKTEQELELANAEEALLLLRRVYELEQKISS